MTLRPRLASFARSMRFTFGLVLVYWLLYAAFGHMAERHGLITPGGTVNATIAALGVATLVLRMVVLFAVPALTAYRLVVAVCEHERARDD